MKYLIGGTKMNREETIKRLEEAQSLPHATIEDLSTVPQDISEKLLTEYLENFAKPTGSCWLCQSRLWVEWGIQHGVGHCTSCGMEVRMYHFLKNEQGVEVRFEGGLQYHPKTFSVNEEEE